MKNHLYCSNVDLKKIEKHVYKCRKCKKIHKIIESDGEVIGVKISKNKHEART